MVAWLGLLALPVIAFYLLKARQRRRPVSTLLFWDQLQPKMENTPLWRKLRRWLSLLLLLLILALLVGALARPAFLWEQKAPNRTIVVIDPSASMAATHPAPSRWLAARAAVLESIERLRLQDEMALISAEEPPRILSGWTSGKRRLRLALESLDARAPLPTGTDPRSALELAEELLVLRENARILVYSDTVWPEQAVDFEREDMEWRGVGPIAAVNAGMTLFAVRRSPVSPGDWQLDAEIVSTAPFSGRLELLKDGEPMDRVELNLDGSVPWRKSWRGSSEAGARFQIELQTGSHDWLAADNRAECELAPLTPLRVLVAGPEDPFLEAVLASIPLVEATRTQTFPQSIPPDTDLIIALGDRLPSKMPETALLLIHPAASGFWGELEGRVQNASVTDLQRKSRLLHHVGLGSVAISEAGKWTPAPGAEWLASSMDNPLLFGRWDQSSRWLVLGFDPAQSDLTLRTAFPVLMANILQSLRDTREEEASAVAVLPGPVETALRPLGGNAAGLAGAAASVEKRGPVFPGWWLVLLMALVLLVAEWYFFNRRITD